MTQTKTGEPGCFSQSIESIQYLEAAIGIEPMNKGFADRWSIPPQKTTEGHTRVNTGYLSLMLTLGGSQCIYVVATIMATGAPFYMSLFVEALFLSISDDTDVLTVYA